MKIERVQSRIVSLPADEPLAGGPDGHGPPRNFVCVSVATDDGLEGIGVTFFGAALIRALKEAVDALGALIIGDDPLHTEAVAAKLNNAAGKGTAGPGGIFTLALSAIDTALWDIKGKAANLPLASLLGGSRSKVPAYASGALMRTFPLNHLAKAAETLVKNGYTQMKTQAALLGDTTPEQEVERIRVVREAIGPDVALMCDVNQRWTVDQAISIGRRFEEFHLAWLEDVTTADDYAGLARVAQQLDMPVTGGEYVYGIAPFRHMFEARSVDIAMIDLFRVGGVTQWMKVAGMAEAFNVPVVSHLIPEIHVHLIAAIPNGRVVEYMPWTMRLFEDPPVPVRGEMTAPTGPGLGLRFSAEIRRRFAAAE
ncbi:MAG: mandelate racemase/muconate lactonizing enzyme family protein [Alphaproteobacteria bacterium]|nr:mandelate racemase/muconate lactonizing enzyme family protein [Alphaproteobacteria bacterium]